MSLAQAPLPDRGASPLMSNNPFRNRIASTSPRPVSTNPFLDTNETQQTTTIKTVSPEEIKAAADFFETLEINTKSASPPKQSRPVANGSVRRPENYPPRPMRGPPSGHRPTLSDEERRRQLGMARRPTGFDIFADPSENKDRVRAERRPRRNSESSIMDKSSMLDPEEEKKRRERRQRDTKRSGTTKSSKPSRKLDVIDKLDVTSIYGTGLFHHDGPFDACNPHRNRRRHRLAPIQAFPKDSKNMNIGGSGPVNSKLDYDKFHGYGQEAHIDYNEARQDQAIVDDDAAYIARPNITTTRHESFNATSNVDQVHGDESAGLGTSTFLEGAPASRAAIQRRESEYENHQQNSMNGLSRKKSLAQKIRAVRPGNKIMSPEAERPPTSPLATGQSDSAVNPFFKEYDKEYERKGQQIAFAEEQIKPGRARAPSSPKRATVLERTNTGGSGDTPPESKPMGLLGRMKSLKKPRSRSERREAS